MKWVLQKEENKAHTNLKLQWKLKKIKEKKKKVCGLNII